MAALLLVEDDRSAQAVFSAAVDRVNQEMHNKLNCVNTIEEAKEVLEGADILIVDLSLPDSNPQDTMDFVRKTCATKPVIVFSGTHDQSIIAECGKLGVGFITKACFNCGQVDRLFVELIRAQGALAGKRERRELLVDSAKALGIDYCDTAK